MKTENNISNLEYKVLKLKNYKHTCSPDFSSRLSKYVVHSSAKKSTYR